jgi:hypothetical protein
LEDDAPLHQCVRCNAWRASSEFFPSWIRKCKRGWTVCKACVKERAAIRSQMHGPPKPTLAHKYCSECEDWHPRSKFYALRASPDGLQNICKRCSKLRHREWYIRRGHDLYLAKKAAAREQRR